MSHYQLKILPCPLFAEVSGASNRVRDNVRRKLAAKQVHAAFHEAAPLLSAAPFDPLLRDAIIEAVDRITGFEKRRGEIARTDRSALSVEAQPYQDFIDRLFFKMAGLSDDDIAGLEQRLGTML